MDFEKEANEAFNYVCGTADACGVFKPGDNLSRDNCECRYNIEQVIRRAYAAGQENMRESASYISQQWKVPQFAKLMAGEMTAQESRTVYAVAVSITDRIRSLPLEQAPKVNEFTPLATTKDIGLE